jgi:hypothetical protein
MDPKKKKEYKEIAKNIKLIKRKPEGSTHNFQYLKIANQIANNVFKN